MSFRLWLAIVRLRGATSPATGGRGPAGFGEDQYRTGPFVGPLGGAMR